jgi:hypothetical protein
MDAVDAFSNPWILRAERLNGPWRSAKFGSRPTLKVIGLHVDAGSIMNHSIARVLLFVGVLLPGSVALAAETSTASPTMPEGATEGDTLAQPEDTPEQAADTPVAAPASQVSSASDLAALKKEVDDLKQEMETQKALAEASSSDQTALKLETLRMYGWVDMGFNKTWITGKDGLQVVLPTRAGTFVLGNVNLYFDIQPSENWSTMIETRFTNLPTGVEMGGMPAFDQAFKRPETQSFDSSSPVFWSVVTNGHVIMERAYIQYRYNDLLQLRVGKFLTPFGIWNVDHGVPTLISLALPVFMIQSIFPRAQIGVQVLGNKRFEDWDLGYTLWVSNGRNPTDNIDPTDDKMYGGRLTARTTRPYRLQIGLSGLTGRYSDMQRNVTSFVPYVIEYSELAAYRETSFGADVSIDIGSLRLRSELMRTQTVYATGKRPLDINATIFGAKTADSVVVDWYLLAAYRLPWLNLEPYFYFEWFKWPQPMGEGYIAASAGLNIYFTAYAQLKVQYIQHFYMTDLWDFDRHSDFDKKIFTTRLVLGF